MTDSMNCPLCGSKLTHHGPSQEILGEFFNCPQCGRFTLTDEVLRCDILKNKYHLLAGYFFEIENRTNKYYFPILTVNKFNEILSSTPIPQSISAKPLILLKYLNAHTEEFGELISFPAAAFYVKSSSEGKAICYELHEKGLIIETITDDDTFCASITYEGMKYIENFKLEKPQNTSQAFVAMWFKEDEQVVKDSWKKIIEPGCADAGYKAIRVLEREYNDSVVDEIIALIRESAFAVVDFSGYRGGVYYEAGYAKGLGKEVTNLCHETWFNHPEKENHTVHFDVNHNNFIVWETGNEEKARNQLTNRILATVGKGTFTPEVKDANN